MIYIQMHIDLTIFSPNLKGGYKAPTNSKMCVYHQFIHKGKVNGEGTHKAFFKNIF